MEDGDLFEYIYLEEYAPAQILQVYENTVSFMKKKTQSNNELFKTRKKT